MLLMLLDTIAMTAFFFVTQLVLLKIYTSNNNPSLARMFIHSCLLAVLNQVSNIGFYSYALKPLILILQDLFFLWMFYYNNGIDFYKCFGTSVFISIFFESIWSIVFYLIPHLTANAYSLHVLSLDFGSSIILFIFLQFVIYHNISLSKVKRANQFLWPISLAFYAILRPVLVYNLIKDIPFSDMIALVNGPFSFSYIALVCLSLIAIVLWLEKSIRTVFAEKEYLGAYIDIINELYHTIRLTNHDMKNHIASMLFLLEEDEINAFSAYYDNLSTDINTDTQFLFDSLSKVQLINNDSIKGLMLITMRKAHQSGLRLNFDISDDLRTENFNTLHLARAFDLILDKLLRSSSQENKATIMIEEINGKIHLRVQSNSLKNTFNFKAFTYYRYLYQYRIRLQLEMSVSQ